MVNFAVREAKVKKVKRFFFLATKTMLPHLKTTTVTLEYQVFTIAAHTFTYVAGAERCSVIFLIP